MKTKETLKKLLSIVLAGALTLGAATLVAAAEETPVYTNVALNKPVTSGRWHNALPKTYINDGDLDTFTYCDGTNTDNENGVVSEASENWYLFDLGAKYKIEYVKLIDNTNTWTSAYNVKILASNDKNFTTGVYEIVNSGVDGFITLGENITCSSDAFYRYVKIQRFAGTVHPGYQYSEFEVYADETLEEPEDGTPVYTNVALKKTVTAGRWHDALPKTYINDGNLDTFTYCDGTNTDNADGSLSNGSENWYIFDLGAKYKIEYVKLIDNTNTWTSAYNVKILASNDKTFESGVYEIVNSGVDECITLGENITCNSNDYYRYVKIQKFAGETVHYGYQYSEFEVYADETTAIKPSNVALNKAVTSGRWHDALPKTYINDGNLDTFTYCDGTNTDNADGSLSDASENWYLFDLGAKYKIEYIKLIDNTNTWTSGYNVKILASNDKNFANGVYEIVTSGTDNCISMGQNINCGSDEYYRYVKIQRFEGTIHPGYQYSEFEVYAYESDALKPTNVALNKPVKAGVWDADYVKANINDGDADTFVWPSDGSEGGIFTDNANGVVSTIEDAWYMVDLGMKYKIEYVKIFDSTETWTSPYNVKVLASNDPSFVTGVTEIVNSGTDGTINLGEALGTTTDDYYRYVKLQKFPGSLEENTFGYQYSEFEVYAYEKDAKKDVEVEIGTITGNKAVAGKFILNVPYKSNEIKNSVTVTVYVAVYDTKNELVDIIPISKTITASNENSNIGGALTTPKDAASYKVFVWKNTQPLTNAKSF